jgi:hypothetical protein
MTRRITIVKGYLGVLVAGIAALSLGAPAIAQASPINECGNRLVEDGVTNITTRNVSCSDARAFADKFSYLSHWYTGWVTLSGWRTYWVHYQMYRGSSGWWQGDVRATRTTHVIHFQIGPYGVSDGGSGKCAGIPAGQPCY